MAKIAKPAAKAAAKPATKLQASRKAKVAEPEQPAKRKRRAEVVEEVAAPVVVTEHKSGRGKIPDYFTSQEFLEMSKKIDKVEDKHHCHSAYMEMTNYLERPISTGIITYDLKLGGGLCGGRVHVEYGGERAAKTTRCTTLLGNCVVDGVFPSYYDAESAVSPAYMDRILRKACGFKLDQLQGVKDSKGNWEAPPLVRYYLMNMGRKFFLNMRDTLLLLPDVEVDREGNYFKVYEKRGGGEEWVPYDGYPQALFLEDSVAALNPSIKGDETDENNTMAALARLLAWGFPQIKGLLGQKNAALFMTNQVRHRPGVTMGDSKYMNGGDTFYHNNDMRAFTEARHCKAAEMQCTELGFDMKTGENFSSEPSIQGGRDEYHYQRIRIEKNKYHSANKTVLMRTRHRHNGKPGDGICEVYDLYQFLRATGQVTLRSKQLTLNVDGVRAGKKVPDLLGANGQVLPWIKFKELVEDRKTYRDCLRAHCQKQIASGYAFDLEAKASKAGGGSVDDADNEE